MIQVHFRICIRRRCQRRTAGACPAWVKCKYGTGGDLPLALARTTPCPLPPRSYTGSLSTQWDLSGNLQNYTGSPVLLGGSGTANPVADDAAVAAAVAALQAPLAAQALEVLGERISLLLPSTRENECLS